MQCQKLVQIVLISTVFISGWANASESATVDPHAAHKKMLSAPSIKIEKTQYAVPNVDLIDSSGQVSNLRSLLESNRPVVINFIYTTCTTICPVITATTLQMQKELFDDPGQPAYISISIDPDYDSARVLKEYASTYGADWTFLTGAQQNVITTLKAFDAYRGNKVNHSAITLMRPADAKQWTRVEGLTSAGELARIWRDASL
ncbi:MAG: SCO family protein [Gammaproteobacteria bacterium]|nr:SCO family protein [Gammaproteobacteria bacterium]